MLLFSDSDTLTLLWLGPAVPKAESPTSNHLHFSWAEAALLFAADSTFLFFLSESCKHCVSWPSSGRTLAKSQEWKSKLAQKVSSESCMWSFPMHCENAHSASTDVLNGAIRLYLFVKTELRLMYLGWSSNQVPSLRDLGIQSDNQATTVSDWGRLQPGWASGCEWNKHIHLLIHLHLKSLLWHCWLLGY